MGNRAYSQTVINFLIGIGLSGGTLIGGYLLYLSLIGAIIITGSSGDSICAGTFDDPCYAYINFTVPDYPITNEDIFWYPTDYDPWGRNTTFEFDPSIKSWRLERSWGSGWRNIPLNKSCTGTWCGLSNKDDTRKFSIAFREGKDYRIRIVAYKNNKYDTIKWSALDGMVDPLWEGVDRYFRCHEKAICINNSRFLFDVNPGTTNDYSLFNFTIKNYDGDATLMVGVDDSSYRPLSIEYFNEHIVETNNSIGCPFFFDYDYYGVRDLRNWASCYVTVVNGTSQNITLWNKTFDFGSVPLRIIGWYVNTTSYWKEVPGDTGKFTFKDKIYYYIENVNVNPNTSYQVKITFNNQALEPDSIRNRFKYDIALMPSIYPASPEGAISALANNVLWLIDPFFVPTYTMYDNMTVDRRNTFLWGAGYTGSGTKFDTYNSSGRYYQSHTGTGNFGRVLSSNASNGGALDGVVSIGVQWNWSAKDRTGLGNFMIASIGENFNIYGAPYDGFYFYPDLYDNRYYCFKIVGGAATNLASGGAGSITVPDATMRTFQMYKDETGTSSDNRFIVIEPDGTVRCNITGISYNLSSSTEFAFGGYSDTSHSSISYIENIQLIQNVSDDPCEPCDGSADCSFDCTNFCNVTSGFDNGGYDINISGSGTWSTTKNITNIGDVWIGEGCQASCSGGGCLQI